MGTIKEKLTWLINKKKQIINTINSKTSYNNTTGNWKPFSGTYASVNWDNIIKEADTLYPSRCPEVIFIRHFTDTGGTHSSMPNYAYPGVSLTVTRTGVGVYACNLSRPSEIEYSNVSIMVMGGHHAGHHNNALNAGVIMTNGLLTPSRFEIRLADDNSLNDGHFTVIISITR